MATQVYGNGTNSSAGANTITHYYDKAGIKAANATSVYAQFADERSMPTNMGKTFKTSKWLHIGERAVNDPDFAAKGYLSSRSLLDLTAGITASELPEGAGSVNHTSISKQTVEATLARYGNMIEYSDEVELFSEDYIQVRYREELGYLANQRSEDLIQRDMLGGSNNIYAGVATSMITMGGTAVANGTTDDVSRISYNLVRKGVRSLVRNRAERNTEIVVGSTKIDTRVVNKAFYAIIGPEVKFDLETTVRGSVAANGSTEYMYIPVAKYASATNLAENEVGYMHDVRFIESESAVVYRGMGAVVPGSYTGTLSFTTLTAGMATAYGAGYSAGQVRFDVFPVLFPTKGAYATVGLKGNNKIKFNSGSPSDADLTNPYATKGFFSYNFWHAGVILREERLLKMLVCASA